MSGSSRRLAIAAVVVGLTAMAAVTLFVALRPTVSWSERIALAETPTGYELALVYDSADLVGAGGGGTASLLVETGASYTSGRWVAVAAVPESPDTVGLDPDAEFPGEDRRVTEIDGVLAAVGTTFDGRPGIVLGPVDGHLVSLVGHDVTTDELTEWASDISVVHGILVLRNGPDMRTVATVEHATVDAVTSLVSASIAPGEGSALVTYQPDEGTTPLQVSNRPVSDGRWALVRFFLGPDGATTTAGREAWAGSLTLANYTINALVFESSGRLVTLASERPVTDPTAWSATVVELSLADWEALRDEAGERFGS